MAFKKRMFAFSNISNPVVDASSNDSGKKRKQQADELDLPLPKYVCLQQSSVVDPCSPLDRFLGKSPETGSSKVISHSFSGDYDFSECSYATYDSKTGKNSPSTSITGGFCMSKDYSYSTGSSSLTKSEIECYDVASSSLDCKSSKGYNGTRVAEDLNQLDLEFISSEFVVDGLEHLQDEENQELLCSKEGDARSFILSSARWSVSTQDAGEGTKKATIDQEFEQYFSALMM